MSGTLALVSIGDSLHNGASVNVMNGIDYSIFTILETMNLTPLIKGNLAHNFMDLYFLCLSFHLDISNMLKTKYIGNTGLPASHRGEKIQFGNLSNLGFPITPLVMSLL